MSARCGAGRRSRCCPRPMAKACPRRCSRRPPARVRSSPATFPAAARSCAPARPASWCRRATSTALAEAIAALAGDPVRREAMGRAGRALVEREFAEDIVARETLAALSTPPCAKGRRSNDPGVARRGGARRVPVGSGRRRRRASCRPASAAAELLRTGALYGMVHAAALIAVAAIARAPRPARAGADRRGLELCRRHAAVQPQPLCAGADRTRMARYDHAVRRRGFARRLGRARPPCLDAAARERARQVCSYHHRAGVRHSTPAARFSR